MIIGHQVTWEAERAFAHPVIRKAVDYLTSTDFASLQPGQYPIQGEDMFARVIELTTRLKDEQLAEKHEQFFDIHYLLEGDETIGWSLSEGGDLLSPVEPYSLDKDAALYGNIPSETPIRLSPGMYMVLFPEDIHRPGLTLGEPGNVRKVVVKINTTLFKATD
ncbi:YhcH/YjgK/YiaL family protein [Paenibacillus solani]|uniref:YhcH/YjgK/YiaL family protein n=1 Tax=Paenibacillus solani TaxID=1705565 RepID=UPI003D28BBFD